MLAAPVYREKYSPKFGGWILDSSELRDVCEPVREPVHEPSEPGILIGCIIELEEPGRDVEILFKL